MMVMMSVLHVRFVRFLPLVAVLVVVAAGATAGCGGYAPKMPDLGSADADKFLFEKGTTALKDHNWLAAREYLKRLVDSYPSSPYRQDGKLGIGDAYMGTNTTESKILAINEFREFLQFFPTSPRADYAQFNIALAHEKQMLSPERDQTETKDTIREWELFFERFPNSKLRSEADTHYRMARDRLSDSQYQVGYFYYRFKLYGGAASRFLELIAADPQYTHRDAVFFYLAESLLVMGRPVEALPFFDRIVKEFLKSEYLEKAKKRVAELSPKK